MRLQQRTPVDDLSDYFLTCAAGAACVPPYIRAGITITSLHMSGIVQQWSQTKFGARCVVMSRPSQLFCRGRLHVRLQDVLSQALEDEDYDKAADVDEQMEQVRVAHVPCRLPCCA